MKGEWLPTEALLLHLRQLDGAPWADMDLTGHRIGKLLGEFGIKSCRDKAGQKRGYRRSDFTDSWERYPTRDEPDQTSEASENVNTPSELGKPSDACSDALTPTPEASDEASERFRSSGPLLTDSDGSDAHPADKTCRECGKTTRRSLIDGLCRACHFAGQPGVASGRAAS